MTKVIADITMSVDGFVTGPRPDLEHGLGHGGDELHAWAFSEDPVDAEQLRSGTEVSGAVVMGRRLFDIVDGPGGWNDDVGYGAREVGMPPFFVVTHAAPETRRLRDHDFTFVTDGIASAIDQARKAAGEKDVVIMGGGDVIAQALDAGIVDQLHLHISALILGEGTPLFHGVGRIEMRQTDVQVSTTATHATYEIAWGKGTRPG
jgi:dihydrofolate reductase